jgi:hypothetical protein
LTYRFSLIEILLLSLPLIGVALVAVLPLFGA